MEVALGYFEEDDDNLEFDKNMSKPAASGIEYLKRVQYETSQHPEVVIVPRPSPKNVPDIMLKSNYVAETLPEDSGFIPNQKAQAKTAADFAYLRGKFIRYKHRHKDVRNNNNRIPNSNDIETWSSFCFGNDFTDTLNTNDNEPKEFNSTCGNPPLLCYLSQINQPLAIQLLDYHLIWFNDHGFTIKQGRWLFALLLCIDKPTPPDALSCLRNISRKFFQLRVKAALNLDKEILYQLYFFIIIVSKYFGQADLSIP